MFGIIVFIVGLLLGIDFIGFFGGGVFSGGGGLVGGFVIENCDIGVDVNVDVDCWMVGV